MKVAAPENMNAVLSAIGEFRHILHLYASNVSRCAVQASFLTATGAKRAVYVTEDDPVAVQERFKDSGTGLLVTGLRDLSKILAIDRELRIVVDAGSICSAEMEWSQKHQATAIGKHYNHVEREEYLCENFKSHAILCTYDISKLSPKVIRQLVGFHDKLMLTTDDTTFVAAEALDQAGISQETIERYVKNELENIVLALLLEEPSCGIEIIRAIQNQFGVLLSPGTIYPLLHDLKNRGLLEYKYEFKIKVYRPAEKVKRQIHQMIEEEVKATRFLGSFLHACSIRNPGKIRSSTDKI